jgi:nitroreductase
MVFKRKSIRKFDKNLSITEEELKNLTTTINELKPLVNDIKVQFVIKDRNQTTVKRGEYCLLMYSEEKPCYLQNAGYMLQQVDLFLASCNIGVCWYGLAKPQEQVLNGLKYVIMLAFGKSKSCDFRKNISEFKRKDERIIWQGDRFLDIAKVVRVAPSGCNLQPWRIFCKNNEIKVYKYSNTKSFPAKKIAFYNETDFSLIDMGICLCYLEISLLHNGYFYRRKLTPDNDSIEELLEIARYYIN